MVVRIWIEHPGSGLRARLTQTLDVNSHEDALQTAATTEGILAAVEDWIEAFVEGQVPR